MLLKCKRDIQDEGEGRDLCYVLVFLQIVSQKVGGEGQLIIPGVGRCGNNTLQILKGLFFVTGFSQRVHIQNQNS